jgi:hypothetical protein
MEEWGISDAVCAQSSFVTLGSGLTYWSRHRAEIITSLNQAFFIIFHCKECANMDYVSYVFS